MPRVTTSATQIDARDFDSHRTPTSHEGQRLLDDDVDIWNEAAAGILERDRRKMRREIIRIFSFICAILSCITSYSLYGGRFLTDLGYTQLQINAISIAAELAMYLPVPFFGYLCDRYSPPPLSLAASILFGAGYLLAAFTYKNGLQTQEIEDSTWPPGVMIMAFVLVGMGTSCMYLSAVAPCAKNFGRSKYRGLILAAPIAAFGLSGMWQSQVGAQLLYIRGPNGEKGEVDVFRYFIFLAGTLFGVGLLGTVGLRIVGEEDMIEEAVEELERSGLLDESEFFRPKSSDGRIANGNRHQQNYGTLEEGATSIASESADLSSSTILNRERREKERLEEERLRKSWLLNLETRKFLTDPTMWFLAAGFFLITGPGEAYINNLGTIIPTLTPDKWLLKDPPAGTPSTHVSIIAITNTIARLLTGVLSDVFAPTAAESRSKPAVTRTSPSPSPSPPLTPTSSLSPPTLHPSPSSPPPAPSSSSSFTLSRPTLLLISSLILLLSFLTLSLPFLVPSSPPLFHLTSSLLGLGYGAIFSLVPIIISVVWGVENFATNWGVMALMPAGGAAVWSIVYSVGYERALERMSGEGNVCLGKGCFEGWAWGCAGSVAVAMVLFVRAGRMWRRGGVVV
ncbi:MAG: hypothetical protein Q9160_000579 [Pyrenula sp. 1 TL-2023]